MRLAQSRDALTDTLAARILPRCNAARVQVECNDITFLCPGIGPSVPAVDDFRVLHLAIRAIQMREFAFTVRCEH